MCMYLFCILTVAFNVACIRAKNYVGCYKDAEDRAMAISTHGPEVDVDWCIDYCLKERFGYAGVQYADQCYCGNRYDKHGPVREQECNRKCPGNSSQICGGSWTMSVYLVDIDECEEQRDRCNLTSSTCTDTPEAYRCDCKPGYQRGLDDGCWTCSGMQEEITPSTIPSTSWLSTGTTIPEGTRTPERFDGFIAGFFSGVAVGFVVTLLITLVVIIIRRRRRGEISKYVKDDQTVPQSRHPDTTMSTADNNQTEEREEPDGQHNLERETNTTEDNTYCILTDEESYYENHPDNRLYANMVKLSNIQQNETSY